MRFFLFVDNEPEPGHELSGVVCGALGAANAVECAAPLPPLSNGSHNLTLVAMNSSGVKSPPSTQLVVTVNRPGALLAPGALQNSPTTPRASTAPVGRATPRTDAPTLSVRTVATGFVDPTDLAVLPEERILVAERSGAVQLVDDGVRQVWPALQLDDVSTEGGGGLLSLATDPAFARTRHVYVAYTTGERGFRVARFRESAGVLAEQTVLLDGVPASSSPSAALRFGPDGKLYIALDDAGDPSTAGDLGSYNGKVLRFNSDGTVPNDQPSYSPVAVANVTAGRSLTWTTRGGRLWIAEGRTPRTGMIDAVSPTPPTGSATWRARPNIVARYRPTAGEVPSSLLAYSGSQIPGWNGDLLVALPGSEQLLRLRPDPADTTRIVSADVVASGPVVGPIQAMALDARGTIYLADTTRLLALIPATAAARPN
jgi:glucose/arabinose dehydrogenase